MEEEEEKEKKKEREYYYNVTIIRGLLDQLIRKAISHNFIKKVCCRRWYLLGEIWSPSSMSCASAVRDVTNSEVL